MEKIKNLLDHIEAMKDDAYLIGHPEWNCIVEEANILGEWISSFEISGNERLA